MEPCFRRFRIPAGKEGCFQHTVFTPYTFVTWKQNLSAGFFCLLSQNLSPGLTILLLFIQLGLRELHIEGDDERTTDIDVVKVWQPLSFLPHTSTRLGDLVSDYVDLRVNDRQRIQFVLSRDGSILLEPDPKIILLVFSVSSSVLQTMVSICFLPWTTLSVCWSLVLSLFALCGCASNKSIWQKKDIGVCIATLSRTLCPSKCTMSISKPTRASTREIVTLVYRSSPLRSNTGCLKGKN